MLDDLETDWKAAFIEAVESSGVVVGRLEATVAGLRAKVERLRASLRILASHDPPWLDDHIRARAALVEGGDDA